MQIAKLRSAPVKVLLVLSVVAGLLAGCSGAAATVASSWPGVAVSDTTAYIAYADAIYAVDLATGQQRWRYPAEADRRVTFYAPPAITADGQLIVGGYDHVVRRLSAEGLEVWRFEGAHDRIIGRAVLAGDLVLVPSADHSLYALNADSGTRVWSFEAGHALWAAPLVDGDRVYVASLDHFVYALNLSDGSLVWQHDLGAAMAAAPALADGVLLAGTFGSGLQALDAATGEPVWSFVSDGWIWGSPTTADSVAYFGDVAGTIYAVDLSTHAELWRIQPDGAVAGTPSLLGDLAYFTTEAGTVYARQASNGAPAWQQTLTGKLYSDPIIAGDALLVAAMQGETLLTALDAASGAIRWSYTPAR